MVVLLVVIAAVLVAATVGAIISARRARVRLVETTEATRVAAELAAAEFSAASDAAAASAALAAAAAAESTTEIVSLRRQLALFDAEVLWALEQRRSERTWRLSVAPAPELASGLADARHPLEAALQIEVDAVREEVGTIVMLDAMVGADITPALSLLTLRLAQELLATVVRNAEETLLQVRVEDGDVVIVVESTDEHGARVPLESLELPESAGVEQTADGAVVRGGR